MKPINKKILSLVIAAVLIFGSAVSAFAADMDPDKAVKGTAAYLCRTVPAPEYGSEWVIIGLARSGCEVPENYFAGYYSALEDYVKQCEGVLHKKKYTDYSRTILAVTAIGKDARNVGGYDLTYPLGDYKKTIWQGFNSTIWALIALDSGDYPMPYNEEAEVHATRQMYVDEILSRQLDDGGWNLTDKGGEGKADSDMTGMALQALSSYKDQPAVKAAIEKALVCIADLQEEDGGFASWGTHNSESCAQIIVALTALSEPFDGPEFLKNGKTMADNLLSFRLEDGSYMHVKEGGQGNFMATEQGMYSSVALQRYLSGKSGLYKMQDAVDLVTPKTEKQEHINWKETLNERIRKLVQLVKANR
ncbi:MAG: terpene cyclase/mutase family protein [Clostridia bacterium]|nr:terpene cyclase/mutase family protein [Clostridia bacterium]